MSEFLKPTTLEELKTALSTKHTDKDDGATYLAVPVPEPDQATMAILDQYPHVCKDKVKVNQAGVKSEAFVFWLPAERKFAVRIVCQASKDTNRVCRTSDLHQVKLCAAETQKARKGRRRLNRQRGKGRVRGVVTPEAPKAEADATAPATEPSKDS